jgi:predicted alpha/beta superfamily hydrolase
MLSRTLSIQAFIVLFMTLTLFISCGGGGGDSGGTTSPADDLGAVKESFTIYSQSVGVTYNISVGLPPLYDETGPPHAAIFLLDGNYYFNNFYDSYDEDDDFLFIGINNSDRRNIDYLPNNQCEEESGGRDLFFDFLVSELIPYLDNTYNIDPDLRLLFGHSHGGSFVFYTLFSDHGDTFAALFSNDASLQCWDVSSLENNYYSFNKSLPVIFYSSAATGENGKEYAITPVMDTIKRRNYTDLIFNYETFNGGHDEILNESFSSGMNWISDQVYGSPD